MKRREFLAGLGAAGALAAAGIPATATPVQALEVVFPEPYVLHPRPLIGQYMTRAWKHLVVGTDEYGKPVSETFDTREDCIFDGEDWWPLETPQAKRLIQKLQTGTWTDTASEPPAA